MVVVEKRDEFVELLKKHKDKKIGFVPTMGALHTGHASLIEKARQENDIVVSSIFVNPLQFNDKNDLINYPKDLDNDIIILKKYGCDIVFYPSVDEMYPENDNNSLEINFNGIDNILEGASRPGHFKGVATVVKKLFDIVNPNNAYFGEKDFQQLFIIRKMVEILKLKINIISCPTIREENGLAMSSRNRRLSSSQKMDALVISQSLFMINNKAKFYKIKELKSIVKDRINSTQDMKLDYVEFIDSQSFELINKWEDHKKVTCCIAAYLGNVRLIDNIIINL